MLTNDAIKNLYLIAIYNINSNTIDWFIEKAYRHYSKIYYTPLHIAKEILTPDKAVLIYLEDTLSEIPANELIELKEKLLNKPKPMLDINNYNNEDEEMSDDEWVAEQIRLATEQEKKDKEKNAQSNLSDSIEKTKKAVENLYKTIDSLKNKNFEEPSNINFDIKE